VGGKIVEGYGMLSEETAKVFIVREHARAVRIVKAEIKLVKLDQHTYRSEERCLILGSLETVLKTLQRGRGGKG